MQHRRPRPARPLAGRGAVAAGVVRSPRLEIALANGLDVVLGLEPSLTLDVPPGWSLRQLFEHLAAAVHPWFGRLAADPRAGQGRVMVVYNDRSLRLPDDLDVSVGGGGELWLLLPMMGG